MCVLRCAVCCVCCAVCAALCVLLLSFIASLNTRCVYVCPTPTNCQEHWEREFGDLQLEFDIPFRELAFEGVPHRSTVLVMPTVNCLVELTEMPFTVVSLEDIEVI